ncbi:hypothetical protein AMECASPLE_019329, partial [Ameca splendens]
MENQADRMLIGRPGDTQKSHWKVEAVKSIAVSCNTTKARMPKSKEVLTSTSGSDSDSEVETKAKRKKPSAPEKPAKKPKSGESSKPGGSSKGSGNGEDNMFQ